MNGCDRTRRGGVAGVALRGGSAPGRCGLIGWRRLAETTRPAPRADTTRSVRRRRGRGCRRRRDTTDTRRCTAHPHRAHPRRSQPSGLPTVRDPLSYRLRRPQRHAPCSDHRGMVDPQRRPGNGPRCAHPAGGHPTPQPHPDTSSLASLHPRSHPRSSRMRQRPRRGVQRGPQRQHVRRDASTSRREHNTSRPPRGVTKPQHVRSDAGTPLQRSFHRCHTR